MELESDILLKLQQYLNDEMNEASRISFETEISNSKDLQEFIAIFNNIDNLEDDDSWISLEGETDELKRVAQLFRNNDTLEFSRKIKKLRGNSSEVDIKTRKPYTLALVTLMVACLAAIFFFAFPKEIDMTQLYTNNSSWDELPSLVIKGTSTNEKRLEVERAFEDENFELAISLSEIIITNTTLVDANMQLYKGVSHLELNEFDKALEAFTILTESNSIDNHKGYWYIALVYLKQENKARAIEALEQVTSFKENYKYERARDLLEELE